MKVGSECENVKFNISIREETKKKDFKKGRKRNKKINMGSEI